MTKTPWYPGDVKPVRVGVYERLYPGDNAFKDYWGGKRWSYGKDAFGGRCAKQNRAWRGLTKEAK